MSELKDLLTPKKIKYEKIRFGRNYDGGYIFAKTQNLGQSIYGFGIGNDISCEVSLKSYFGGEVQIFESDDLSISLPDGFVFNKKYVTGDIINDVIKTNNTIILKMDIEGSEYDCLNKISSDILNKIEQMVIEFHLNTDLGGEEDLLQVMRKLTKTHKVFHIHGNECCGMREDGIPYVIEVSFIRKDVCEIDEIDRTEYPIIGLDFPNLGRQDLIFKWW